MNTTVLAISSRVAASRVGLGAIEPALAGLGVETCTAATCTLGRHPGWGAPGGGPVSATTLASVLEGARQHPRLSGPVIVLTGYFSSADQVRALVDAIDPAWPLWVDPVMGDAATGLYVAPEVAEAIAALLIPRAALVFPNAWEAERLTGLAAGEVDGARQAGAALGRACVITSVVDGPMLGAAYVDADAAWFAAAPARARAPHGVGDALAARFLGRRIMAEPVEDALAGAVGDITAAIDASAASPQPDELTAPALLRAGAPATVRNLTCP